MEGFKAAMTMVFAVKEINGNPNLLPYIKIGYRMYDNCMRLDVAFRAATALVSGNEKSFSMRNCSGLPPVVGIVGDAASTHSIAISSVLGLFRVPMVCSSKKLNCEHIPSDHYWFPDFLLYILRCS